MIRLMIALAALLVCTGCGLLPETDERRIVHSGDMAVLRHKTMTDVPIAMSRSDAHALARAVESGDAAQVRAMVEGRRATLVPVTTRVQVVSESFNEREVKVLEGEQTGASGWVPYEWLAFRRTG